MDRIRELTAGAVFDRIRKLDPDFLKRITPVDGDLVEPNMGLSEEIQKEFITNVEVIIISRHLLLIIIKFFLSGYPPRCCGCTIRWDTEECHQSEHSSDAGSFEFSEEDEQTNGAHRHGLISSRSYLKNRIYNFQVIVHVSTAYSNCPLSVIDEKFYEPQCDPYRMIELAEKVDRKEFDEDTLITLTPKIVRPWPNTYSFTKALCEDMVKDYGEQLPITVVRPSIGKIYSYRYYRPF